MYVSSCTDAFEYIMQLEVDCTLRLSFRSDRCSTDSVLTLLSADRDSLSTLSQLTEVQHVFL